MEMAIAASVAGGLGSAASSIMQGREQSRAASFEQQQLRIQEQQTRTAAAQQEASRREELTASIETIQAMRAGRGLSSQSPTGLAIIRDVESEAMDDMRTERLNTLLRADQSRMLANLAGRRARTSLLAGYLGGAAELGATAGRLASMGRGR
jgi:hypothetical protein